MSSELFWTKCGRFGPIEKLQSPCFFFLIGRLALQQHFIHTVIGKVVASDFQPTAQVTSSDWRHGRSIEMAMRRNGHGVAISRPVLTDKLLSFSSLQDLCKGVIFMRNRQKLTLNEACKDHQVFIIWIRMIAFQKGSPFPVLLFRFLPRLGYTFLVRVKVCLVF